MQAASRGYTRVDWALDPKNMAVSTARCLQRLSALCVRRCLLEPPQDGAGAPSLQYDDMSDGAGT